VLAPQNSTYSAVSGCETIACRLRKRHETKIAKILLAVIGNKSQFPVPLLKGQMHCHSIIIEISMIYRWILDQKPYTLLAIMQANTYANGACVTQILTGITLYYNKISGETPDWYKFCLSMRCLWMISNPSHPTS
jgi:hypothetical protein